MQPSGAFPRKTFDIANSVPISANWWPINQPTDRPTDRQTERPRARFSPLECCGGRSVGLSYGVSTRGLQRVRRESQCVRRAGVTPLPSFYPAVMANTELLPLLQASPPMLGVASEPPQPWTCLLLLAHEDGYPPVVPPRVERERFSPSLPPSLLPSLYIGTLLQWRLINPLTQCVVHILLRTTECL